MVIFFVQAVKYTDGAFRTIVLAPRYVSEWIVHKPGRKYSKQVSYNKNFKIFTETNVPYGALVVYGGLLNDDFSLPKSCFTTPKMQIKLLLISC